MKYHSLDGLALLAILAEDFYPWSSTDSKCTAILRLWQYLKSMFQVHYKLSSKLEMLLNTDNHFHFNCNKNQELKLIAIQS